MCLHMATAEGIREIDDPAALRALAHPLRLRLLASLRITGSGTASMLARRLGESSGSTSFHLRTLARHGFVVEDEALGSARERWWRASDAGTAWSLNDPDPGRMEAGRGLTRQVARDHARWVQRFLDELPQWPQAWRETAVVSDHWAAMTPERLAALSEEVTAVIARHVAEAESGEDGAERVMVIFQAFPQRGELP